MYACMYRRTYISHRKSPLINPPTYLPTYIQGVSSANQYIFVLANSLELEQEMKLRLQVLRKISGSKKSIPFQYIGMFAGE